MTPEDRLQDVSRYVNKHVELFLGAIQDVYQSDPNHTGG